MIRALVLRNLRHHRGLLAGLAIALAAFEIVLIRAVAAIEEQAGLSAILAFLPPQARRLLESQIGLVSFSSAVAFAFEHPAALAGTIAFVTAAATLPAAERESGFLDLVLARPMSRHGYLTAVVILLAIGAVLLPLALLAGAAAGLALVEVKGELPWTRYAPACLGLVPLLLAVGGVALLFASGARRRGTAVARAAGVTIALWVVELLAGLWPPLEYVRWASPFHYFDPIGAALSPPAPAHHPLVLLAAFAACVGVAYARFSRRDI